MPMRRPLFMFYELMTLFSPLLANSALQRGREHSGLFCCAATDLSETLSVGQVVQKGFWHGSRGGACGSERLSLVLCCTSLSHSHRNQILFPTQEKLQVCHLPFHFTFLEML